MTPQELPALLASIRDRVLAAAEPAAMGMAKAYRAQVIFELTRYAHPAHTRTPSPPGQPPAMISGALAASVTAVPGASSGAIGRASVAPHTVYAAIQEYGGPMHARPGRYMHWISDGIDYYAKHVILPPRPYLRPAAEVSIADGSLGRAAAEAFEAVVWGR